MAETLEEMTRRVGAFQRGSVPSAGPFPLAPGLSQKVAPGTGELLPYHGSTVVHGLDDATRALLATVADELHDACGAGLAQRLPPGSFHVTLHDLRAAARLADVAATIAREDPVTAALVDRARQLGPVEMRLTTVFNLVSTSVVVGLLPATEADCARLHGARALFDHLVPSDLFTPHVTLAYYRPGPPEPLVPSHLADTLDRLTRLVAGTPVSLTPERLHAARFSSMSTYWVAEP